jgi:hypothetical protein
MIARERTSVERVQERVQSVTYAAGSVVRCPALRGGKPCRKPFGLAQRAVLVRVAEDGDNAPFRHRCAVCGAELSVSLGEAP